MKSFLLSLVACFAITYNAFAIQVICSHQDASCANPTGAVQVDQVLGATLPVTYQWSTGATTYLIQNLVAGTYTVFVTDANGDTASTTTVVGNTNQLISSGCSYLVPGGMMGGTHPCRGQCNGVAYLDAPFINGTPPYTATINSSTNPNLYIGSYFFNGFDYPTVNGICTNDSWTLYITDANGCAGIAAGTQPYLPNSFAVTSTINPACGGNANGNVHFDFYGNNFFTYTLTWSGPSGTGTIYNFNEFTSILNKLPGLYTITVSQDLSTQGCDSTFTVTIPDLGTNCGQIAGNAYLDTLRNCLQDVGEPPLPGRLVEFTPGPYFATTDAAGNYAAMLPYNTYTVTLVPAYNFSNVCSTSGVALSAVNDTITGIAIADSANVNFDISLGLSSSRARPGFNFQLYGNVHNNSYVASDTLTVEVNYNPLLVFNGANWAYTNPTPGLLILTHPGGLSGFGDRGFFADFTVPANPGLIGSILVASASVLTTASEANFVNNSSQTSCTITGSFDPNEKSVSPTLDSNHVFLVDVDSILTYTIYFQNTGSDTAFNVVLIDTLSSQLNISSVQMVGASHPARMELSGTNILKAYFDNIQLPDSTTNEVGSHGQFTFSINTRTGGMMPQYPMLVNNVADIYFDFNPPIRTNVAFVNYNVTVGLNEVSTHEVGFSLSPNPAKGSCLIQPADDLTLSAVRIVDMQGRVVKNIGDVTATKTISLDHLSGGVYFLKGDVLKAGNMATKYTAVKRLVVY